MNISNCIHPFHSRSNHRSYFRIRMSDAEALLHLLPLSLEVKTMFTRSKNRCKIGLLLSTALKSGSYIIPPTELNDLFISFHRLIHGQKRIHRHSQSHTIWSCQVLIQCTRIHRHQLTIPRCQCRLRQSRTE